MTTEPSGAASDREAHDPVAFSDAKSLTQPDAERLVALRGELEAGHDQWSEQIAATVEEDYRQLLRDLGLR